jgi:enamine deaminase RidA (YjgF/YER057c/UK114 family)
LLTQTLPIRPQPKVPDWVVDWIGAPRSKRSWDFDVDGVPTSGRAVIGKRFSHVRVRVHGAAQLPDLKLQHATTEAYLQVRRSLDDGPAVHPVRFWNFIPGIGDPAGDGLDRYMVFNAGRYAGFSDWFHAADRNQLAPRIATATGIGHPGADLVVHCLADRHAGQPIENPRQCAAYRYSEAYGPLPPCFARATVVEADEDKPYRRVIVGGTSSIVGEASVHIGDVPRQTDETLDNIHALLQAAGAPGLEALHHVRVYHVDEADAGPILARVERRLPKLGERIELVHAPLCRPDLGVEIEGLADGR